MNTDEAVIVALGGNLALEGQAVQAVLELAAGRLADAGLKPVRRSGWWRSAAWPDPTQPAYLNAVAWVETALEPRQVLEALLGIETAFGRRRSTPNAPRTLDLDLIAYGRRVVDEPGLILPHPRAADRLFVMGPLAQIAPAWRHPVSGETASALAAKATVGVDATPI
jgi:2-amino-4-hydroxy-6-hydroxymethyldihydropteridine diphosphokinase